MLRQTQGRGHAALPLRIDEVIERAFRTAAFDGRKVSLWVISGRFAIDTQCPLLPESD
jgi:hypothetical protein